MRLFLIVFALVGIQSTAMAAPGDMWTVKAVSCTTGELAPAKTLAINSTFAVDAIRAVPSEAGSIVETATEAVLVVKVSGNNDGACKNNDQQTIEILTFTK